MIIFLKNRTWTRLFGLKEKKSIFNTNDEKKNKKKSLLWLKDKGKRIIVFEFFTFIKKLHVSDFIPNIKLF